MRRRRSRAQTLHDQFQAIADRLTDGLGSPWAIFAAAFLIVVWVLTGPIFGFSDTWQLVINTATTIVTFHMVFVIQDSRNRQSKAMHFKLDELIRSNPEARNRLIEAEKESEAELSRQEKESLREAEKPPPNR
jgi:low affinity Fe/Cu permease